MQVVGDRSIARRGTVPFRYWIVAGIAALFALALVSGPRLIVQPGPDQGSLWAIDRQLRADFPLVQSFNSTDVAQRLEYGHRLLLLDVRTPEEFAVSHLPGAIRVDPSASKPEILAAIGSAAKGRDIVFYCSVGVRSTRLANRLHAELASRGASAIGNLSGGIFGWHNQGRRLIGTDGMPTVFVHPFDREWGRLVKRQDRISFRPNGIPEERRDDGLSHWK